MPVVATGEFDDSVSARKAASYTDGAHGRFGTGADESNALHARKGLEDQLGDSRFVFRRSAVGSPLLGGLDDRLDHARFGVSEDHRPPGSDVIDEPIAIEIVQIGALGTFDKERMAADGSEGSCRGVDPTGNQSFGSLECSLAFGQIDIHSRSVKVAR